MQERALRKEDSRLIFELPARPFLQAVREVSFAASTDTEKPDFKGILFEFKRNELILVASDEKRMSISKIKVALPFNVSGECVPMAKSLEKACRSFFPGWTREEDIQKRGILLQINPDGLEISPTDSEERELIPCFGGAYPDWRKVVPEPTKGVVFQRLGLLESLRTSEKGKYVKIDFLEKENLLRLRQGEPGRVESESFLPAEGQLLYDVGFPRRFLINLLENAIYTKELRMEVNSPSRQVVFRRPGDESFQHLIMPLNLKWE